MRSVKKSKDAKQIERHIKGVANHWRIEILFIVSRNEGISLDQITESLDANIKTISEHTKKMLQAGLISKKYKGRSVGHSLTPYGAKIYKFIQTF